MVFFSVRCSVFILFVCPDITVLVDGVKHQVTYLLLLFVLSPRREAEDV